MGGKVTQIESRSIEAKQRPTICLLPGGPGLSSATLRSMDLLSRSFHLAYIDPPGTGGTEELETLTPQTLMQSLADLIRGLNTPVILCGHSYGALYAMELCKTDGIDVRGLVLLAPGFLPKTWEFASKAFRQNKTATLQEAENRWNREKTKESFKAWFLAYGPLFFLERNESEIKKLIQSDQVSAHTFLEIQPKLRLASELTDNIRSLSIPTTVIAGEKDILYPAHTMEADAKEAGYKFYSVSDAGHFLAFDQPNEVARLIEENHGNKRKANQ